MMTLHDLLFGFGLSLVMILACLCLILCCLLVGRLCVMTIRWFFEPTPAKLPPFVKPAIKWKDTPDTKDRF